MHVPDPAIAQQVADALTGLAGACEQSGWDLAAVALGLRLHWQGHAATAAGHLLDAVLATTSETGDTVLTAAATWSHLAAELRGVDAKIRFADAVGNAATAWGIISLVQAGVDPVSDAWAAGQGAMAEGTFAVAYQMLRAAVRTAVEQALADRAAFVALRTFTIQAAVGLTRAAITTTALEQFEYGRVRVGDVVSPSVALALVPSALQPALVGQLLDPLLPRPTPHGFPTRASYDAATTAADDWAGRHTAGALVRVDVAPGGGARVSVYGGGPPLRAGRTYSAADLETTDPSLARLLDQLEVYAPGPATAVLG